MNKEQKQTILDLPKVIAVGIASPVATILTSRFGVAGTLIGLALTAVILTTLADILKVYLARAPATVAKVPDTVVKMPGGLRTRLSWRNIRSRLRAAFARFSSLPPASARRRFILIGSVVAAGVSFLVGLSIVTALELGVGKSLSCWVWNDCSTESSTEDGRTPTTGTLPSILGGSQSGNSVAPKVQPPPPQQPIPSVPTPPSQPKGAQGSEQPSSPQPAQRWSPSGFPVEGDQQPSSSGGSEEDAWRSPVERSEEDEQRTPTDGSEGAQQQEDKREQPSSGSDRQPREPTVPSVPWTT